MRSTGLKPVSVLGASFGAGGDGVEAGAELDGFVVVGLSLSAASASWRAAAVSPRRKRETARL